MLTSLTTVTKEDRCELYDKSLALSSQDRQVTHLAEEMAEVMVEVSHLNRGRVTDTAHLVEEIADVLIMFEQMAYTFGALSSDIKIAVDAKLHKYREALKTVSVSAPDFQS